MAANLEYVSAFEESREQTVEAEEREQKEKKESQLVHVSQSGYGEQILSIREHAE
jgi:hypothetical protein